MTLIQLRTTGRPRKGRKFNSPRRRPRPGPGRWGWQAPFTIGQILAWADAYHARTGTWPNFDSGRIADAIISSCHAFVRSSS